MAEEKNIPGVATEKESDEVLETRSDPGSRLFFQRNRKLQDRLPFQ